LVVVGCSMQSRCAQAAAFSVVQEHERAEQLHRVGVELRLPLGERGAELQVPAAGGDARFVVALALFAAGLLLGVVVAHGATIAPVLPMLFAFLLSCDVCGDLLDEAIREPLRIGGVAVVAASIRVGEFEQAAERARGVGVLVAEGEAVALSALLALARLPVVLGRVLDLG
jgi:hypothetical protein